MNMDNDWKSLSETWQAQPAPGIDVAAVRREATQRGRSLRFKVWTEVAMVVLYLLFSVWIVQRPESDTFERIMFTSLSVFLVTYQAYVMWLRRRELFDAGLDVHSLVDLELRRANTTLHYWRFGMWTATAAWIALYVVALIGMHGNWPLSNVAGLAGGLLGNLLVTPAIGLFGVWRCRRESARIARYRDLQAQLKAP